MLLPHEAHEIVGNIGAGSMTVTLTTTGDWYLQVSGMFPDAQTGMMTLQKGGKLYVSPHSTEGEIVQKALSACLSFMEHEVREGFTYEGVRLFHPHIDIRAVMQSAQHVSVRAPMAGA